MIDTFATIMPLLLASTLSPGILALTVILLSKKKYGLSQVFALLIGSVISSIICIVLGLVLGEKTQDPTGTRTIDNIVDLCFALLFTYFGIKSFLHKDKDNTKKFSHDESRKLFLWLGIGFLISITNFDAVIFDITAAKEIGQAAIDDGKKLILYIAESLFFNMPIVLPLVVYLIAPKTATKILDPLNNFLTKYGRFIVGFIFLGFGIYLGYKGIVGLI